MIKANSAYGNVKAKAMTHCLTHGVSSASIDRSVGDPNSLLPQLS